MWLWSRDEFVFEVAINTTDKRKAEVCSGNKAAKTADVMKS
jgi:hypothetical protein